MITELNTKEFNKMPLSRIREAVERHFQNKIQGKTIVHVETGLRIQFFKNGRKKTVHNITKESAPVIKRLPQLLRTAKLIGSELPKHKHPDVIVMLVFLITCKVDGTPRSFRVLVMKKATGNFQYDLYDNGITQVGS